MNNAFEILFEQEPLPPPATPILDACIDEQVMAYRFLRKIRKKLKKKHALKN